MACKDCSKIRADAKKAVKSALQGNITEAATHVSEAATTLKAKLRRSPRRGRR